MNNSWRNSSARSTLNDGAVTVYNDDANRNAYINSLQYARCIIVCLLCVWDFQQLGVVCLSIEAI